MNMISRILVAAMFLALSTFAAAETTPMFSYQGRVRVHGQPYNGNGQFKFAIVSANGNSTLWSYNGTGVGGSEPSDPPLLLPVTDGIFDVVIGDVSAGQQPINPVILKQKKLLKLRSWFSDGTHGFQKLHPDTNLLNLTELTNETGSGELALYVSKTGNDDNNGLTTTTAKLTVQAAVDTIPGRLNNNAFIIIFPGTYSEKVELHGLTTAPGKTLHFVGDSAWDLASAGAPTVAISGADDPSTAPTRDTCLIARFCDRIIVSGIDFRNCTLSGATTENGYYDFRRCLFRSNGGSGVVGSLNSQVLVTNCRSVSNSSAGFHFHTRSSGVVNNCEALQNGSSGFFAQDHAHISFRNRLVSNDNHDHGIQVWVYSELFFNSPMTGEIKRNNGAGVNLTYFAHAQNYYGSVGSGNIEAASNGLGTVETMFGSEVFW